MAKKGLNTPALIHCNFPLGFVVWKRLGRPTDPDPLGVNGIWQRRMTRRGRVSIRMRFYRPRNPRTPLQQANRDKFRHCMTLWMSLTPEQKAEYNKRARRRQMFGWGLFIREYYQANP